MVAARTDWYDAPLYYEIAFQSLTERETAFVDALYDEYAPGHRRRVLEPACGAGRLVAPLAARGYDVTGFDRNDQMLAFARARLAREGLTASLHRGDLARFDVGGEFELAYCMVNSFKYLLTDRAARAHLRASARSLVPGGIYALGLHLSQYGDREPASETWRDSRHGVEVHCIVDSEAPNPAKRLESMRSTLRIDEPAGARRYESAWQFRTYSAAELRGLLASVPELRHVATYDFDYEPTRPGRIDGSRLDVVLVLERR